MKAPLICWTCDGSGKVKEEYGHNDYCWEYCARCKGSGKIPHDVYLVMNKLALLSKKNSMEVQKIRQQFKRKIVELERAQSKMVNTALEKHRNEVKKIKIVNSSMDLSLWD